MQDVRSPHLKFTFPWNTMLFSVFWMLAFLVLPTFATKNETKETSVRRNGEHPAATMWCLHPLLGLLGTIANSFVLYMFYIERDTFINSINVMIWMETIYRLIISAILIPWKSLLMGTNYTLFSSFMSYKMVVSLTKECDL